MVLDLRLSKDWDVEMTSFLFFTLFPTLFWHALRPFGTIWNCLRPLELFGTPSGPMEQSLWLYLERAKRYWNHLELFGTPLGLWNALRPLERPQGSCGPCIVLWQEIISPSYYPLLERAKRKWNGPWPMELREALLERTLAQLECALAHYRLTYALHDIAHVFALPHASKARCTAAVPTLR